MILSRVVAVFSMMIYTNVALAAPIYKQCSFINSKEPSFDLIVDINKKIVILHGDKAAGVFMIIDNEVGRACDNKILPCGSFASNLNGGILGKHTVTVEKDKIFFSAQSLGSDKLYNAHD